MKKDNIEEIYGVLEAFSMEPPKELWDNIEARLHPKKKKRRGIIFFWGSAAAVLVLLVGNIITDSLDPNNKPIKEITDIEHRIDEDSTNKSGIETTKIADEAFTNNAQTNNTQEDSLPEVPNSANELLKNVASETQLSDRGERLKKKEENNIAKSFYKKNVSDKEEKSKYNNRYAQNIEKEKNNEVNKKDVLGSQKKNESIINYEKEKVIVSNDSISQVKDASSFVLGEELIANNEDLRDSIPTNTLASSKWSVDVLGGLSNTASESSIQGTSVNTTSQNDFLYALKVGYAISDRLVVKSGIGKNVLGQEINNIKYASSDASLFADNPQSIVNNQDILFFASPEAIVDVSTSVETINEGTLQQQFDYVQVPLEVSYNLLSEQKYNVALGIGGNVNFLTNNRAYLNNEEIGESLDVNSTIFGATINSNISYELAKKIVLFIEPSYNYFERPIDNNNQRFNNTQFRALFGLRYKF